jgi:hypothetical protein
MRRREFLAVVGGAIAVPGIWPTAAHAQKQSMPVIGFLHPGFPDSSAPSFDALRKGLRDAGFAADETIKIEAGRVASRRRWHKWRKNSFSFA